MQTTTEARKIFLDAESLYWYRCLVKTQPDPDLKPLLCDVCQQSYNKCCEDKTHPFTLD